jgi:hypothetical protein
VTTLIELDPTKSYLGVYIKYKSLYRFNIKKSRDDRNRHRLINFILLISTRL